MIKDNTLYSSPPVFEHRGQNYYIDSFRKKLILLTPQEELIKKCITYLINDLKTPAEAIHVKQPLSKYINKLNGVADIIIEAYDESKHLICPLVLIRCRLESPLSKALTSQTRKYAHKLNCHYCMVMNDEEVFYYKFKEKINFFRRIDELPIYEKMLSEKYSVPPKEEIPERLNFKELDQLCERYLGNGIGNFTYNYKKLTVIAVNLMECLIYTEHKLAEKQFKLFRIVKDCGVQSLKLILKNRINIYRPYRSFLIEYKDRTEIISVGIAPYVYMDQPNLERTAINVVINRRGETRILFRLIIDDNVKIRGDEYIFTSSCKKHKYYSDRENNFKIFITKKYRNVIKIKENHFFFGTLTNNRLWNLDDPEVENFIVNLISYALIQEEYKLQHKVHDVKDDGDVEN